MMINFMISTKSKNRPTAIRRLCLVLGDQLWMGNPALADFDPAQDCVLMIEAHGESTAVWSHKQRIALFLSAMRHFCNELHAAKLPFVYLRLDDENLAPTSFDARLSQALAELKPQALHVCESGEWGMHRAIEATAAQAHVTLTAHTDTHFMSTKAEFAAWATGRKELRMEFFYREMRRKHGVLMVADPKTGSKSGKSAKPIQDVWNFDADNRAAYPKTGPGAIAPAAHFEPDGITRDVFAVVERHFADHPGDLASFGWPVTRAQALVALQTFVDTRLARFGASQDAMWTHTPFGWHSLLSTALNLHLLDPREVIHAAEAAFDAGKVDIAGAEGFIRQILGWREFIRGVYWFYPELKTDNHFNHQRALPRWYWSGDTHMACMRDTIGQTLKHGYAHHIQRLMVTGQFALLAQIAPQAVADWYLAVYVDAIEWVELPNVAGMTLYANGGKFTSKPYIASGAYIKRQSNYCQGCRYKPEQKSGPDACPMTTLYWAFLAKNEAELQGNPRTALMVKNLQRLSADERLVLDAQAERVLNDLDSI